MPPKCLSLLAKRRFRIQRIFGPTCTRWASARSIAGQLGHPQASVAGYLPDNVRATYAVGGAADDDHRQLRSIESDTGRSLQDVDRPIGDPSAEIAHESGFLLCRVVMAPGSPTDLSAVPR
jgi:hypothetical protein